MAVDMNARYRVEGWPGVAWYLVGYAEEVREVEWVEEGAGEDGEDLFCYDVITEDNPNMVRAIMVGDDREHLIDVQDLVKISDSDYCPGCGQIGCKAYA